MNGRLATDAGAAPVRSERELRRAASTLAILLRRALRAGRLIAGGRPRSAVAARELRRAFEELGPTYVKFGQIIASSPGLFPDVLSEEFRACLDSVPPAPIDEIRRVIVEDLGGDPEGLFEDFDLDPLASASIAQVHAARLKTGEDVVVKVQRPHIGDRLSADLRILRRVARLVALTSTGRMANPVAVVDDFATTLAEELDFTLEGRYMEEFERNLHAFGNNELVRVPKVHWDHTSPRVLTMERIHGYKIDDWSELVSTGWDLEELLKRGVRAWMEGALVHGLFHGDVHAGNLMVDAAGRVVFLDFGIMGRLDDHTREVIRRGLPALLINGDYQEVAKAVYEMGAILKPRDLEESSRDIAEIVKPLLGKPLGEISYGEMLVDIIRIGTRYDVRLPRELVLVSKQMLYFERYAKMAAPDWAIVGDPELISFLFDTSIGGDGPIQPLLGEEA